MDCTKAAWELDCATHAVKTKVPLEQRMVFHSYRCVDPAVLLLSGTVSRILYVALSFIHVVGILTQPIMSVTASCAILFSRSQFSICIFSANSFIARRQHVYSRLKLPFPKW
jgi:hypothetical protein